MLNQHADPFVPALVLLDDLAGRIGQLEAEAKGLAKPSALDKPSLEGLQRPAAQDKPQAATLESPSLDETTLQNKQTETTHKAKATPLKPSALDKLPLEGL